MRKRERGKAEGGRGKSHIEKSRAGRKSNVSYFTHTLFVFYFISVSLMCKYVCLQMFINDKHIQSYTRLLCSAFLCVLFHTAE